jgi:hypothetical protein
MYRVRFHLSKGDNFRKWQIRHPDGSKTYHDPAETSLAMLGCYLRNSRRIADRIHAGATKSVCAWVLCREVAITTHPRCEGECAIGPQEVKFNPRVLPYWHDERGTDLDGSRFHGILTLGRQLIAAVGNQL